MDEPQDSRGVRPSHQPGRTRAALPRALTRARPNGPPLPVGLRAVSLAHPARAHVHPRATLLPSKEVRADTGSLLCQHRPPRIVDDTHRQRDLVGTRGGRAPPDSRAPIVGFGGRPRLPPTAGTAVVGRVVARRHHAPFRDRRRPPPVVRPWVGSPAAGSGVLAGPGRESRLVAAPVGCHVAVLSPRSLPAVRPSVPTVAMGGPVVHVTHARPPGV